MNNNLDGAIARVANARRVFTSAQTVAKAAEEARATAFKSLGAAETELQELLNEQVEAHLNAG